MILLRQGSIIVQFAFHKDHPGNSIDDVLEEGQAQGRRTGWESGGSSP